ncbi:hypothetical protein [Natranaerobius trueperi]|nr:hypothetical protein [Natranaerobius trueperi]
MSKRIEHIFTTNINNLRSELQEQRSKWAVPKVISFGYSPFFNLKYFQ